MELPSGRTTAYVLRIYSFADSSCVSMIKLCMSGPNCVIVDFLEVAGKLGGNTDMTVP